MKYGVISNEEFKERVDNANPHLPDRIREQLGLKCSHFHRGRWIDRTPKYWNEDRSLEERVLDLELLLEETHHLILDIYGKLTIPDPVIDEAVRKLMKACRTAATGKEEL